MMAQFQLEIELDEHMRTNQLGSVFHGALMEMLPSSAVNKLHDGFSYHPLKQRLIFRREDKDVWEIVSFDDALTEQLTNVLQRPEPIHIKHQDVHVPVLKVHERTYDIDELLNESFAEGDIHYVTVHMLTPMSFKANRRYSLFPDVRKFFRSIMLQFDAFVTKYKMYDRDTLDFIAEQIHIANDQLKSTRYYVEGGKIPSFTGEMTLQLNGPIHFRQLLLFLLHFGSFSGCGVKTSLGMGKYIVL